MKINFNNVRRQAVLNYEVLVKRLNNSIDENGNIVIPAHEIQRTMDNLRMMIGSIAACYDDTDENFKNIYEELFPEEGQSLTCFNPEE